nr:hypothetical protein [Bosea sp. F3-2]
MPAFPIPCSRSIPPLLYGVAARPAYARLKNGLDALATLALEHLKGLEAKIVELQTMADTIRHLAQTCHGDDRPDCPILADIAEVPRPEKPAKGKQPCAAGEHRR